MTLIEFSNLAVLQERKVDLFIFQLLQELYKDVSFYYYRMKRYLMICITSKMGKHERFSPEKNFLWERIIRGRIMAVVNIQYARTLKRTLTTSFLMSSIISVENGFFKKKGGSKSSRNQI